MRWYVLVLALACAIGLWANVPATAQPTGSTNGVLVSAHNLCPGWANQVSRTRQGSALVRTLHNMGCVYGVAGWHRGHTHCMRVAYAYTATTRHWQYAAIGKHGCNLAPSGVWVQG